MKITGNAINLHDNLVLCWAAGTTLLTEPGEPYTCAMTVF